MKLVVIDDGAAQTASDSCKTWTQRVGGHRQADFYTTLLLLLLPLPLTTPAIVTTPPIVTPARVTTPARARVVVEAERDRRCRTRRHRRQCVGFGSVSIRQPVSVQMICVVPNCSTRSMVLLFTVASARASFFPSLLPLLLLIPPLLPLLLLLLLLLLLRFTI